MRPNIEKIRENWIPALRSGKYPQGQLTLKHNDHYCCLGVLCEISPNVTFIDVDTFNETRRDMVYDANIYDIAVCDSGDYNALVLPRDIAIEYGIHEGTSITLPPNTFVDDVEALRILERTRTISEFATQEGDDIMIHLTSMNDTDVPFDIIADVLEDICDLWEVAESAENKGG